LREKLARSVQEPLNFLSKLIDLMLHRTDQGQERRFLRPEDRTMGNGRELAVRKLNQHRFEVDAANQHGGQNRPMPPVKNPDFHGVHPNVSIFAAAKAA
jgi:hypothetical protein